MERLSIKIHHLVDSDDWKPIRIAPQGPPISHLFFADDVLLFCQASIGQGQLVADTLKAFCDSSGLKININKSKAISSRGVSSTIREDIRNIAPIPFVRDLGKYLGFPLTGGRMSRGKFNYLLESITRKLASWKTNLLNLAGRVCLTKSVIASIPTYTMQVFWLPRSIINSINQTMRRFIWSKRNGQQGWHLVKWSTITRQKEAGGLGVKDMGDQNTALLGKSIWQLLINSNKLWVQAFSHKYLQGHTILSVPQRTNSSPVWKSMIKARDQLRDGFQFRLGAGNTSIWFTNWSGHGYLGEQLPYVHISDTHLCLRDVIQNNQWHLDRLTTCVPDDVKALFSRVKPTLSPTGVDTWTWNDTTAGRYTVREGYHWLRDREPVPTAGQNWAWIWKLAVPEKVRVFIWLCIHDALPVNSHRFRCHLAQSEACTRCSATREDGLHGLRDCPHSKELWGKLGAWRWRNFWMMDLAEWIKYHARGRNATRFLAGLWNVWKWRCNMILDPQPWSLETAWRKLCREHDEFIRIFEPDLMHDENHLLMERWRPPSAGFLKLNSDGSFRDDTPGMGGGGLLRDYAGQWICGFISNYREEISSPFLAEALALRDGLLLAWERGARQLICDSDCQELVQLAKDPERALHHAHGWVLTEIQNLLTRRWRVELSWCCREVNAAADLLAKQGLVLPLAEYRLLETPSQELEVLLLKDVM